MSERFLYDKPVIRPLDPADARAWQVMRGALYGAASPDEIAAQVEAHLTGRGPLAAVLVAEADGTLAGFIEISLRPHAEGCGPGPVPYVEGWFVNRRFRHRGIGRALMAAAEAWAAAEGHREIASDTEIANDISRAAHRALGFRPAGEIVCYRKTLSPEPTPPGRGFRVRALGEIAIRCADLARMEAFYRDVIGLSVLHRGRREGIVFFALGESHGGHTAVLALFAQDALQRGTGTAMDGPPVTGARASLHHLALTVDAAEQDAAIAWFREQGVEHRVEDFAWIGWRGVFTTDPEGNTVELVAKVGPAEEL